MKTILKQSSLTSKLTWLVFGLAVIFADVMYLQLVWSVVYGVLAVLALGGAFALGASVIMLPIKLKNGDIADGQQRAVAISVLLVEFGLMILNTIVAFAEAAGDVTDQFLSIYATYVAPATPIIVAAGFLLIWLFDPIDQAERAKHQARTIEAITKAEIEADLRIATLEGVRRNIDSAAYRELVDAEIQRRTLDMLRDTFGTKRLDAPVQPLTIDEPQRTEHPVTPTRDTNPQPVAKPVTPIPFEPVVGPSVPPIKMPSPTPPPSPKPAYTLQSLLTKLGAKSAPEARDKLEQFGIRSANDAYMKLRTFGRLPADLTRAQFDTLYVELMNGNNNDAGDDDESRWIALDLNRNGNHPNR